MPALDAAKRLLPPVALDALRRARAAAAKRRFAAGGRVPWSPGYNEAKWDLLRASLADARLLDAFRTGGPLPAAYARGFDERLVEYPWALARLPAGPGRVLDAGSVLNNPELLRHPALGDKKVDILTLAPEEGCYWWTGASYVYDDLRRLPLRDGLYDHVVCVSTLEHVGFDNTGYTGDARHSESDPTSHREAVREFARVLRPGGTLLLTVPFGRLVRIEVGQQFDAALLDEAVRAFGPAAAVERTFYAYSREGWRTARAEECAELEFVRWRAVRPWPRPLPVEPDLAASARAVACVRIVK